VPLLDEDYLILSTIHSAKGQEWKSVYLLNAVDGCMPSDLGVGTSAEIEEERRLLYVRDPRKGRSSSYRAATLLRPWSACARRSSPLCLQDAVHS
jgi:superfamily I DNA/RNA helicase